MFGSVAVVIFTDCGDVGVESLQRGKLLQREFQFKETDVLSNIVYNETRKEFRGNNIQLSGYRKQVVEEAFRYLTLQ